MSTAEVAAVMNDSDATVPAAVRAALPSIVAAIDGIVARMASGGRLIYVGAGSSGRLGVLDASECPPTFGTDPGDVVAIIAGGPPAIVSPVEAAEDDVDGGRRAIDDATVDGRRCRGGHRGERAHPVRDRRARARPRPRCAHGRPVVQHRGGAQRGRRAPDRGRRRARGGDRLDAAEGRHGTEAGAQHDLDHHDGAPRQDVREPDGRPAPDQREAAGAGGGHRGDDRRCRATAGADGPRGDGVRREGGRARGVASA